MYHAIILGSDYEEGKILALHFEDGLPIKKEIIQNTIKEIVKIAGKDTQFSIHKMSTKGKGWSAVCEKDDYFTTMLELPYSEENVFLFASSLKKSQSVKAKDIALLILSVCPCTQLKLQKLLYFCYADYLCKTGKKMFEDPIYAYQYGPVVQSVLEKYKSFYEQEIEDAEGKDVIKLQKEIVVPTFLARMVLAKDGEEIASSCIKTLERYKSCTSSKLVTLTHRKGSPWDRVYNYGEKKSEIPTEYISKYHSVEELR